MDKTREGRIMTRLICFGVSFSALVFICLYIDGKAWNQQCLVLDKVYQSIEQAEAAFGGDGDGF